MAALLKCDKCGKTDKKVSKFVRVNVYPLVNTVQFSVSNRIKSMDVCKDCYKKVFNIKEEK